MRVLTVCLALALGAPLGACGSFGAPSDRTFADKPNAAAGPMRAGRGRARADMNRAVDYSTRGY